MSILRKLLVSLHVYHSAQLLDSVQQEIALLDTRLVLSVLQVRSVCLDESTNAVNHTIKPTLRDELGQFAVDEIDGHAKRLRHRLQRQTAVRFEDLSVSNDAHLAAIVTVVRTKEPVNLHMTLHGS